MIRLCPATRSTTGLNCRTGSGRLNVRPSSIFLRGCNGFNADLTSLDHDLRGYASSTERSRENHRMDGWDKPGRDASSSSCRY